MPSTNVAIYSSVGGGPVERLASALLEDGVAVRFESLFGPSRWRALMKCGVLGRVAARVAAMGVFPIRAALSAVSSEKGGIVPTTNPFFLPHMLVATRAAHGKWVVPLVYDLYPEAWEAAGVAGSSSTISRFFKEANKILFANADAVVFIGERMARHAIERCGEPRRWTVIETGADCDEFDRARDRIKVKGGAHQSWIGDRVLVTYSGNLGRVHDWEAMARGFELAFGDGAISKAAACVIAASGPGAGFMKRALAGLSDDVVRFIDPLDDKAWAEMMARSNISIVTLGKNAANTSIPSKVFSAMAAHNAIVAVAPRDSDLAAIVQRCNCGLLVAPEDGEGFGEALTRLLRAPDQSERYAKNAEETVRQRYDMSVLAERWKRFLTGVEDEPRAVSDPVKRTVDVLGALCGLAMTWPVMAATGALIRATMGKPVFFRQTRPGLNGAPFGVIKFRTMRPPREGEDAATSDSARITAVGRALRALSIDELPTLLNVLRGEMSLVGPRPLLMRYLDRYSPEQARRNEVKPGITGWAQVHGRNAISWEEKFALDVWYVDHRNLALDLKILAMTVLNVLKREGISHEGDVTMHEFMGSPGEGGDDNER